ncbi:alpha-L-rhamnosidase N-terminal domain-containing protein, partial [bacterium]|nr:alpha-L-rhamnosidase N-terminal domain-containing protein [bacterium]
MPSWAGHWIWTRDDTPERNAFVRFRRQVAYTGGPATLHITADSRYWLWVNGEFLGHGPVRAWPSHWKYDTYDLAPHFRKGDNVVAVLVQHFGEGNFQYNLAPPGLLAELKLADRVIVSDSQWRAAPEPALAAMAPRISVQEAFEEQFDAREASDWTARDYDDSRWPTAVAVRHARDGHFGYEPRGIPFLTAEPVLPQRLVGRARPLHPPSPH